MLGGRSWYWAAKGRYVNSPIRDLQFPCALNSRFSLWLHGGYNYNYNRRAAMPVLLKCPISAALGIKLPFDDNKRTLRWRAPLSPRQEFIDLGPFL